MFEELERTGSALEDLAQLCEAQVEEAGRRIGDILGLVRTQTEVVAGLCGDLAAADLTSGIERTVQGVGEYLVHCEARSQDSRRVWQELADTTKAVRGACRQVEQSSASTRVLTLQTRIEGVRLDAGHVGYTATQVGSLNRELSQVTNHMRELLDGFDAVLRSFLLVEGQTMRSTNDFVIAVARLSEDVMTHGHGASDELAAFANQVSVATNELVGLTAEALSSLQFQDPLTQEYRAIRAGIQTPSPNLDALMARVERTVGDAYGPLERSRTTLTHLRSRSQTSLQVLQGFSRRFAVERPLSKSVGRAQRTLEADAGRLLGHTCRMRELVVEAKAICVSLIDAETRIRIVSEQTRLVAANAAIEAARVGGKGRATSGIAKEMSRLNVRVCEAADRVFQRTSDVQSLLPVLVERTQEAEQSIQQLVDDVLGVFHEASERLVDLEASLRAGLRGQPDVVRQIAQTAEQAIRVLAFEASIQDRVDRIVQELRASGAERRHGLITEDAVGVTPDDHPVEAGEFLLF